MSSEDRVDIISATSAQGVAVGIILMVIGFVVIAGSLQIVTLPFELPMIAAIGGAAALFLGIMVII